MAAVISHSENICHHQYWKENPCRLLGAENKGQGRDHNHRNTRNAYFRHADQHSAQQDDGPFKKVNMQGREQFHILGYKSGLKSKRMNGEYNSLNERNQITGLYAGHCMPHDVQFYEVFVLILVKIVKLVFYKFYCFSGIL